MPDALKILLVEDSPDDAFLAQNVIRSGYPACSVRRVAAAKEFIDALDSASFDLILSDYTMPGFGGLAALDLARQKKPGIPFIFLSGTIGEERAVEALRRGASDYVLKDRPARLVPAIRQAIERRDEMERRRRAELEVLRSQRMESIGMLTGGIAHDLNNVLAPIVLAANVLQQRILASDDRALVDAIESSAQHGAALIRQLLAFAHGGEGERVSLQVRPFIGDFEKLLRPFLPRNVRFGVQFSGPPPSVVGNATQLSQVLMNLCLNARDAMPEGGDLSIRVEHEILGGSRADSHPEAKPGPCLRISVTDTGTGISADVIDKIFDPFFTTKESGKGTGLGLATVHAIVRSHGGFIEVSSVPGAGTTFVVRIPCAAPPADARDGAEPGCEPPRGRGQTILVIDDNDAVRGVIKAVLEHFGYVALTATDGVSGIAAFQKNAASISLVITDMMLPGPSGSAIIEQLRGLKPGLGFIAISGLAEGDLGAHRMAVPEGVTLLTKPLKADRLVAAVARLLG